MPRRRKPIGSRGAFFRARSPSLKLDEPAVLQGLSRNALDSRLVGATGARKVIVRLSADSGAAAFVRGADTARAKQNAKAQQDAFVATARTLDPGARVVARVQAVLNAVFLEVDASVLPALARDPRVVRIAPVGNYEIDLTETVPYIGASAVQAKGVDGKGIRVAVLDSGIDYLHAALGGSGNPAHFAANNPAVIEPGTFPTAKVVGGYDFVGSAWTGARQPAGSPGSGSARRRTWPRSRDACRTHHRRRRRRCARREPRRHQGVLVGVHGLLGHCADPGHGIRRRSQRRRQVRRSCRHHQHVARLAVRAAVRRRSLRSCRQRDGDRCAERRLGRELGETSLTRWGRLPRRRQRSRSRRRRCRAPSFR